MKIIKATTASLICLFGGSTTTVSATEKSTDNIPPTLQGATPTVKYDVRYDLNNINNHPQENPTLGAEATSGYTYTLRINATLPLETSSRTGGLEIDECIDWPLDSNPDNFTWYGLRVQLPDDATSGGGSFYSDIVKATKEMGFVQDHNTTNTIMEYNITTKEIRPTIRIIFNDRIFWDAYEFDLGTGVEQEFRNEMRGAVSCYQDPLGSRILTPVIPTLVISLQRLGSSSAPPPTPASSAGAVIAPRGNPFGRLGLVVSAVGLALSTTFV